MLIVRRIFDTVCVCVYSVKMSWKTDYEGTDELKYFTELTQVPRPSRHLDRIREYLVDFAKAHGLEYEIDEAGNVLIRRKGTSGKTIVLQGHIDIVATVTPGHSFDFVNYPLDVYIENGWMHARNTTLGADDGGGLALMLCALTDPGMASADLECLFTVDEEIGLIGAARMKENWVSGKYLINLDNEDVNEITIGSAGSTDIEAVFGYSRKEDSGKFYRLDIEGLRGGHSAIEIDKKRGNAILLAAGFMKKLKGVRIASFTGGSASNVIPMTSSVVFSVPAGYDIDPIFEQYGSDCILTMDEPGFVMSLVGSDSQDTWSAQDTGDYLDAILTCPNGAMDADEYGVKTSSNIGVVEDTCKVIIKPRSSDIVVLRELVSKISAIFQNAGADVPVPEIFPAWRESEDCHLVKKAVEIYKEYFGRNPIVTITHGGLESSTIKDKCPGMEAIAIGPTIHGAHTPDECMDLRTLTEMKGYLFELIRELSSE